MRRHNNPEELAATDCEDSFAPQLSHLLAWEQISDDVLCSAEKRLDPQLLLTLVLVDVQRRRSSAQRILSSAWAIAEAHLVERLGGASRSCLRLAFEAEDETRRW